MLREPRRIEKTIEARKGQKKSRFQILKLEERIAPAQPYCPGDSCGKHGRGGRLI